MGFVFLFLSFALIHSLTQFLLFIIVSAPISNMRLFLLRFACFCFICFLFHMACSIKTRVMYCLTLIKGNLGTTCIPCMEKHLCKVRAHGGYFHELNIEESIKKDEDLVHNFFNNDQMCFVLRGNLVINFRS